MRPPFSGIALIPVGVETQGVLFYIAYSSWRSNLIHNFKLVLSHHNVTQYIIPRTL